MLPHTFHVPSGSNPRDDLEAIFLHELLVLTSLTDERRRGHFIGIHSRKLIRLLGKQYRSTLSDLEKRGVIEINDRYSGGKFSKSYRLSNAFRKPVVDRVLIKRPLRRDPRNGLKENDLVGQQLYRKFGSVRLGFSCGKIKSWDDFSAIQIACGNYFAKRCEYGRFHSNFTSLSRRFRGSLQSKSGEPLIELDIANSQPLIIGLLCREDWNTYGRPGTGGYLNTLSLRNIPQGQGSAICIPPDLEVYLRLCESGQLYSKIASDFFPEQLCLAPDLRDSSKVRDSAKINFLTWMFAQNDHPKPFRIQAFMAQKFPTVASFVRRKKEKDHRKLAHDCQRCESRLLIDGASAAFMATAPTAPIITVHDSFLVLPCDESKIRDCILDQFRTYGISPLIRVKSHNPLNSLCLGAS